MKHSHCLLLPYRHILFTIDASNLLSDSVLYQHLQLDFTESDYVAILHINNDNERPRSFSEALLGVKADNMHSLQFTDWVQCHGLVLACIHCLCLAHTHPTMSCIPLVKPLSAFGGWWHLNMDVNQTDSQL